MTESAMPKGAEQMDLNQSRSQYCSPARKGMVVLDSFFPIRKMQREMNGVFSQFGLDLTGQGNGLQSTVWIPTTEMSCRDGNLIVLAESPGPSEKDVKVEVNDDFPIIRANAGSNSRKKKVVSAALNDNMVNSTEPSLCPKG